MNEVELSRVLDGMLAGTLGRASVDAILITASGALLTDAKNITQACADQKKYRAAVEEWTRLCGRILDGYDQVLVYFNYFDPDALERAYETITVALHEQSKLLGHLPGTLLPSPTSPPSFWDQDPEQNFDAELDALESLLQRTAKDPLKRFVGRLCHKINEADLTIVEELDPAESKVYLHQSGVLNAALQTLCNTGSLEQRVVLFETVEKLMEERLDFHLELIS